MPAQNKKLSGPENFVSRYSVSTNYERKTTRPGVRLKLKLKLLFLAWFFMIVHQLFINYFLPRQDEGKEIPTSSPANNFFIFWLVSGRNGSTKPLISVRADNRLPNAVLSPVFQGCLVSI